jgi:hypothetical protein
MTRSWPASTKYQLTDRATRSGTAHGATLARLIDTYGLIDLDEITPRPVTPADRAAIAGRLAARAAQFPGSRWQLWDGTAWQDLPAPHQLARARRPGS